MYSGGRRREVRGLVDGVRRDDGRRRRDGRGLGRLGVLAGHLDKCVIIIIVIIISISIIIIIIIIIVVY